MNDWELLQQYVQTRSEQAFAELAQRHIDWICSSARRQVGDEHLAEDVTQGVFIALAAQARHLHQGVALSTWLFQVTRYTSTVAMRSEIRRKHHEGKAAAMMPESSSEITQDEWERLAPVLDELVEKLAHKDRLAVLLRFYQHKGFREIGQAMEISEEAARKRTDRAVEKLRAMFARRGVMAGSTMLAGALAANTTQPASAAMLTPLVHAALGGAGGTAMAGQGLMFAKGAMRIMMWAKVKIAAVVMIGALGLTGAGTAIVVAQRAVQPANPPAAPAPVAQSDADEPEAQVAGRQQLARWDVILNQTGADIVSKVGKPMQTASKVYQAMACNGAQLRRAVREAMAGRGVERVADEMEIAYDWGTQDQPQLFIPTGLRFHSAIRPGDRVVIFGGSEHQEDTFVRNGPDRLHIKLNHPGMEADVQELTDQWRRAGLTGQAIVYDGEIAAGEAVAFLGQYVAKSGTPYYHLVVWETFKADPQQMPYVRLQRDAGWWCQNGPGRMRRWADAARLWAAQATHKVNEVAAPFEKKLEDGKVVRLIGLCRPAKWPFCWWDADGKPVEGYSGMISVSGEPPQGLWALVEVSGAADEYKLLTPTGKADIGPVREYHDAYSAMIDNEEKNIEAGVLVGPWKELGRPTIGEPLTVDGVTYLINRPTAFGESSFLVHFKRTGAMEHEDCLTVVGQDGTEAESSRVQQIVYGHNSARRTVEKQPNFHGVPLAQVQYYRLSQRKRQWVTFNRFATEPNVAPQTVVTKSDVAAAEMQQQRRRDQAKRDEQQAKRKSWAAVVPDTTTAMGAVRMLVNAVKKGDEKAVRELLVARGPKAVPLLDAMAHLFVSQDRLRTKTIERYGEAAVREKLSGRSRLFRELEAQLMGGEWKKMPDGVIEQGGIVVRPNAQGQYYMDLDSLMAGNNVAQELRVMAAKVDELERLLDEYKALTLDELKAAIERTATTRP